MSAEDTDGECRFRFAEPTRRDRAGQRHRVPVHVPAAHARCGSAERSSAASRSPPTPIGAEPSAPCRRAGGVPPAAWLPWWLALVVPVAVALAAVLVSLLPKQATVPNLKGAASVFAAQKLLNNAGFQLAPRTSTVVDATKQPGTIADQSPRAGAKAKRGSLVTVAIYTGTGKVVVPSVLGTTPGSADQALRASQLTLGAVSPQPLNPNGQISLADPAGRHEGGGRHRGRRVHARPPRRREGCDRGAASAGRGAPRPRRSCRCVGALAAVAARRAAVRSRFRR